MPQGLQRFQESGQSHFVTFSCYHRRPNFTTPKLYDLFLVCLENTRRQFDLCVYGYVVMPEHVHLLVSEPPGARLADAIHNLKVSFSKRAKNLTVPQVRARSLGANLGPFWQARYYDRNVRNHEEFTVKLRYLHKSRRARTSGQTGRLEVEQLPPLCVAGDRSGRNRIPMDGDRS